jgi:hypothetical protein
MSIMLNLMRYLKPEPGRNAHMTNDKASSSTARLGLGSQRVLDGIAIAADGLPLRLSLLRWFCRSQKEVSTHTRTAKTHATGGVTPSDWLVLPRQSESAGIAACSGGMVRYE